MKFRISIEEFKALSEEAQKFYKEKDGVYELQVEGMVSKKELSEFRDNNIALKKQIEEITEKFKDIDPEEYTNMKKAAEEAADKKLLDEGDLEAVVEKRVDQMKKDFESRIATLTEDRDAHKASAAESLERLSKELIDSKITQAVMRKDLGAFKSEHLQDALARGRAVWRLVDGEPVPYGSDGGVRFGKDGKSQMTVDEWAEELTQTTPGFWESSQGGDAPGSKKNQGNTQQDRERMASLNPVERMREARKQQAGNA